MNIIYACGVGELCLRCLEHLLLFNVPKLLLLSDYNENIEKIIKQFNIKYLIKQDFKKKENLKIIKSLNIDFILSIHFPFIFSKEIIVIVNKGIINLHPSYLPFNRGFHTHHWAIIDETLAGATLHLIDENIDTGYIIDQESFKITIDNTTNDVYKKVTEIEYNLFKKNLSNILKNKINSYEQNNAISTNHFKKDLDSIKELRLDSNYNFKELLNILRSCTTNNYEDGCYFYYENNKYYVQISINK